MKKIWYYGRTCEIPESHRFVSTNTNGCVCSYRYKPLFIDNYFKCSHSKIVDITDVHFVCIDEKLAKNAKNTLVEYSEDYVYRGKL